MFELLNKLSPLPDEGIPALVPPAGDPAWESIDPAMRDEILSRAAAWAEKPWPVRTATGFLAFVRTGSRKADEDPYFSRRRKLCWAVLRCCAEPDTPLDDVVDGLWLLCEETSWVISAHNVNPIPGAPSPAAFPLPDPDPPYIDLFSAQTGMILSIACALLRQRLDAVTPMLAARVRRELEQRILTPFMTRDEFWWMGFIRKDLCNWTPWILSNILWCAFLNPMDGERRRALVVRAGAMLDRWLDVVPADGGCDEGAGYWNMAGGALLDCLELLEKVAGIRLWDEPKIRNILRFPLCAELGGGWFVNFADCDARPFLSGERLQFAGEKLGEPALIALGQRVRGSLDRQLSDVPHLTRLLSLLFHPAGNPLPETAPGDTWLPDLQLRVVRRGAWTLACKGGHNGESHNHNDVGSFLLFRNGEPEIVDAGNMTYTAKTFSDRRYELWNTRSAWHNLPLIGGAEQQPGAAHAAREVALLPDGLSLDLADAYGPEACVGTLRRALTLTERGLTLRDEIALREAKPVTWVFLLRHEPALEAGCCTAGDIRIRFSPELRAEAEERPVDDPRMAACYPGSLWRIRLTAAPSRAHDRTFTVEGSDPHA